MPPSPYRRLYEVCAAELGNTDVIMFRSLLFKLAFWLVLVIPAHAEDDTQSVERSLARVDYYHGISLSCGILQPELWTLLDCQGAGRAVGHLGKLNAQLLQLRAALLEERDAVSDLAASHNVSKEKMNEAIRHVEEVIRWHDFAVTIHDAFNLVAEGGSLGQAVLRGRRIQQLQKRGFGMTPQQRDELMALIQRDVDLSVSDVEVESMEYLMGILTKAGAEASSLHQMNETRKTGDQVTAPDLAGSAQFADVADSLVGMKDLFKGFKANGIRNTMSKPGGIMIVAQIADRFLVQYAKMQKLELIQERADWMYHAVEQQNLIDQELARVRQINLNLSLIDQIRARNAKAGNCLRSCIRLLCESDTTQSFFTPPAPPGSFGVTLPILNRRIDATLQELGRLTPAVMPKRINDDPDAPDPGIVQRCAELDDALTDAKVQEEFFRTRYNEVNRRILNSGGEFSQVDADLKAAYRAQIREAEEQRKKLEEEYEDKECPEGRPLREDERDVGEDEAAKTEAVRLNFEGYYTGEALVIADMSGVEVGQVRSAMTDMQRGVTPSGHGVDKIMKAAQTMSPTRDHRCPHLTNGHALSGGEMCQIWAGIVNEPPVAAVKTWPTGSRGCAFPSGGPVIPVAPVVCQHMAVQNLGMDPSKISTFARWDAHSFDTVCFFFETRDVEQEMKLRGQE